MQGLLAAAVPAAALAADRTRTALSSSNLARHTSSNPPAPRRTVQQYLASILPIHAANAYELGPPPEGELDHVKTPPRAVEAKRKRRLQDLEDRGKSWIRYDDLARRSTETRRAAEGEALVLIRADSPRDDGNRDRTRAPRASAGDAESRPRKPLVVTAMKRRSSAPGSREAKNKQATGAAGPFRPHSHSRDADADADADSDKSSVLLPRAMHSVETSKKHRNLAEKPTDKENKPAKRKEGKAGRRHAERPSEAAEQDDLDDLEDRLRGRRERRRQNALIRKNRSLPAAAVGIAAAAKVKKAAKETKRTRGGPDANSDASTSSSDEQAGGKPAKRASKEDRSRERVGKLERPSNVAAHRLTVKPVQLGIFSKGKASARAKVGAVRSGFFDEEAFLAGPSTLSGGRGPNRVVIADEQQEEPPSWLAFPVVNRPSRGKTYGNRPAKRRTEAVSRILDEVSRDDSSVEGEQVPARSAEAQQPADAPAKRRREKPGPPPAFWLDIPAPRSRPNSLLATPPAAKDAPTIRIDGVEQQSTQASALSAASLARRKAVRALTSARSVAEVTATDTAVRVERGGRLDDENGDGIADVDTGGHAATASEPPVDLDLHSPSSAHTSSIGRLIAEIASPASDKQEAGHHIAVPLQQGVTESSFDEVLDFAPSMTSFPLELVGDRALLASPAPEFTGVVSSAAPTAVAPADYALDDMTGAFVEPRDVQDDKLYRQEEVGLELFDVPSSLPSVSEPIAFASRPVPQQTSDEAAFREAMLRQWPKTTL